MHILSLLQGKHVILNPTRRISLRHLKQAYNYISMAIYVVKGVSGAYNESAAGKAYTNCKTIPYEQFDIAFQDQAKKALESALGGKKNEFEKWDKEIKKREEAGGGGGGGGDGLVDQTVSTTSDVSTNDVVYSRFPTHQPA